MHTLSKVKHSIKLFFDAITKVKPASIMLIHVTHSAHVLNLHFRVMRIIKKCILCIFDLLNSPNFKKIILSWAVYLGPLHQ